MYQNPINSVIFRIVSFWNGEIFYYYPFQTENSIYWYMQEFAANEDCYVVKIYYENDAMYTVNDKWILYIIKNIFVWVPNILKISITSCGI